MIAAAHRLGVVRYPLVVACHRANICERQRVVPGVSSQQAGPRTLRIVKRLVDARCARYPDAVDNDRAGRAEIVDVGREKAAVVAAGGACSAGAVVRHHAQPPADTRLTAPTCTRCSRDCRQ